MEISDTTLLRRWQRSADSEAFAEIVARHSAMVFATSNRILRNPADAEDVTQECFMELGGVRTLLGNTLGGLLHTLATHRSLDRIKSDSRRREREIRYAMGRPVSCTTGWDDLQPHIDGAIANLPIKYRECLIRHYLEGQTHATVAQTLGIAESTVRYRLTKGIERVRADLRRKKVIATTDSLGTLLDDSRSATPSTVLATNLGKLSVAGPGPAVPSPTAVALASGTIIAKKALTVVLLIGLAGLLAWTVKPGAPPSNTPPPMATHNTVETESEADEGETPLPMPDAPMPAPVTTPRVLPDAEETVAVVPATETPEPALEPAPPSQPNDEEMVAAIPVTEAPEPTLEPTPISQPNAEERVAAIPVTEAPVAETEETSTPVPSQESESMAAPPIVVANLEAIQIDLPEAFFGGTPLDYWGPNLEPENYNDRPPVMAPIGTAIISAGKPVTASSVPTVGVLKQLTDGDKDYAKTSLVELPDGLQWVQVDLEEDYTIQVLLLWKFHEGKRIYFDLVVQVSDDPEFKEGVTTLYNNDYDNSAGLGVGTDKEYIESHKGRLIDAEGITGRYIRVYGKGNTANDFNHFIEIEVWGQ